MDRVVDKGATYVIFCPKTGVSAGPSGWGLTYSDMCEVVKVSEVDPSKTKVKDKAREELEGKEVELGRRGKASSSMVEPIDDAASTGKTDGGSDSEDLSETDTFLEGEEDCPSDDEYVRSLRMANLAETDAVREMIERGFLCVPDLLTYVCFVCFLLFSRPHILTGYAHIYIRVDLSRYVVRVAPNKGVVTLRWRWDEKDRLNEEFADVAQRISRNASNRAFTLSCSGSLSRSTPEEIADTCMVWYAWHRCWMYDFSYEVA